VRPVMAPAEVGERAGVVQRVRWTDRDGTAQAARIARVIDDWDYLGRWWITEVRRHYQLLETEDGRWLELYREGSGWWVSRANG